MRRKRILVIDDYAPFATSLGLALSADHEVVVARSATEAIEALQAGPYDAVLCDLMMDGFSGIDLHRELSAEQPETAERMIFMTGGGYTEEASAFLERVSNRRIQKPFQVEALHGLLNDL